MIIYVILAILIAYTLYNAFLDLKQVSNKGGISEGMTNGECPNLNILPNGNIIKSGNGTCPNGCRFPLYDRKDCTNEIVNGKAYRKCKWTSNSNKGCSGCGAVLLPKIIMVMLVLK